MEYDKACPRCKTTQYRNPSLKLMVNICGHNLCESCVELLFVKGSGSCPECGIPLRRTNFRVQLFENPMVEKEVEIRKRVLRDYNKKEEDFGSLEEYNDYLEEVEDIIYNLTNNVDIVNTNKRIEAYKRENKDAILKNKQRLCREDFELERQLEKERELETLRKRELAALEADLKRKKNEEKEALIEELMFSNANGAAIVHQFAKKAEANAEKAKVLPKITKPVSEFSTGVKFTSGFQQTMFTSIPAVVDEGVPFHYVAPTFSNNGPQVPDSEVLQGYMRFVRSETASEVAGGYKSRISCLRALQEALQGLYS